MSLATTASKGGLESVRGSSIAMWRLGRLYCPRWTIVFDKIRKCNASTSAGRTTEISDLFGEDMEKLDVEDDNQATKYE
jgi:hypothetical protein